MRIFVGGMKPHHQRSFEQQFPSVDFSFATCEEPIERWTNKVGHVDFVLVDQSRTTHKKVEGLRRHTNAPIILADSKAMLRKIIYDYITTGRTTHYYGQARDSDVGVSGSEAPVARSEGGAA